MILALALLIYFKNTHLIIIYKQNFRIQTEKIILNFFLSSSNFKLFFKYIEIRLKSRKDVNKQDKEFVDNDMKAFLEKDFAEFLNFLEEIK